VNVNNDVCDDLAASSEDVVISENKCQMIDVADDSVRHLWFCDVETNGLSGCVQVLDDSGTQMSLVNPKVTEGLDLPWFGKVVVRGAVGEVVSAPLVNLQIRLPSASDYTGVTCVVREGLNMDLILVADIVAITKLYLVEEYWIDSILNDLGTPQTYSLSLWGFNV